MKTYNLLVCIFLFANAFCLLRKKHATIKNSKEFKCKIIIFLLFSICFFFLIEYAKAIIKEINLYRKSN